MMEAWLGSTVKRNERSLSPVTKKRPVDNKIVLGVLGTRSSIRLEELETDILAPLIEAWGMPDEIIIPSEGDSSHAIQIWADVRGIPTHLFCCDWTGLGRKAGLLRDSRIQRDATHLLMLQGPRSNALMHTATRLARKGRHVVISERPGKPICNPLEKTND